MLLVTGDTHGDHDINKLSPKMFPLQKKLTRKDYLLIAGDFGGLWYGKQYVENAIKAMPSLQDSPYLPMLDRDEVVLNEHQNKNYTTLFIDGNHENFDLLNQYEVTEWNGGKVQFIKPNVIHLMRGEVYNIDGKTIFVMGGAESVDRAIRKEGVSWWPQEMPTMEECEHALENLDKVNWKVDYVITHAAPDNVLFRINPSFKHDFITNFLFTIDKELEYKHWYFGHYHDDNDNLGGKHTMVYQKIIELE